MDMVILTALGVGGATVVGALIGFIFKKISHKFSDMVLGFAAGAMVYVVVEELIPEMSEGEHSHIGTFLFMIGFSLMIVLDVSLG